MKDTHIRLAHGGGGMLMRDLIEEVFRDPEGREPLNDAAVLGELTGQIAFTTDSYVVSPVFFAGGNIGDLAIHGTVNDLACMGARPRFLSCGVILEEGFPVDSLKEIVATMRRSAREAGVRIVTGDTKVVPRGKGDGVFINTAGIGEVQPGVIVGADHVRPGDALLVSGPIGDHGIAIMAAREGLELATAVHSDSAPLWKMVERMLGHTTDLHCLRDITRGGLAAVLTELAEASGVRIEVQEEAIPVRPEVRGAADILGLDVMHLACEGRMLVAAPEEHAAALLEAMRAGPEGEGAALVGQVTEAGSWRVEMRTRIGGRRIVDPPLGELLPRIC